ncbi:MAG: PAS domain S-box protein, partial [Proteobacteria bacterium]|nr:PAS domain S-box protein [Pseudomonadota bacterium]
MSKKPEKEKSPIQEVAKPHKLAVEALQKSEEKYRTLFEESFDGLFITSPGGKILDMNKKGVTMFGYDTKEEILSLDLEKDVYANPSDRKRILSLLNAQGTAEYEVVVKKKNGETMVTHCSLTAVKDERGGVTSYRGIIRDITERKQAEEERKAHIRFLESLARIDQAIKHETDVEQMLWNIIKTVFSIFDCDRAWLLYPCDPDAPSFRVSVEISRPEYPGAKVLNVDVPMSPGEARNMREALESDDPVTYTAGTERPISTAKQFGVQSQMFVPLYPKLGKPWVFGMHQCSYPRIWTKEEQNLFKEIGRRISDGLSSVLYLHELQDSEERYRNVFEHHTAVKFLIDPDTGSIIEANEAAVNYYGWSHERLKQMKIQEINTLPPEDIKKEMEEARTRKRTHFEFRHRRADGSIRDVEVFSSIIETKGKGLLHSIIHDITERKRAEEALHEANAYNRSLIETSLDPLVTIGPDGRIMDVSAATEAVTGYTRTELIGKDFSDYFTEPEKARAGYGKVFREGSLRDYPLEIRHRDGHVTSVLYNASVYRNDAGDVVGVFAAARDITDSKRVEEALKLSEAKYRSIFENAVEGIFQTAPEGQFITVNPALARMHGFASPEEMIAGIADIGKQIYVNREDREQYRTILEEKGEVNNFEALVYRKDGNTVWTSADAHAVKDADGNITRFEGTVEDITPRKLAEEELKQTLEKLRKSLVGTIQVISLTVETRDPYTAGHQRKVSNLARVIAQEMDLPNDTVDTIRMAGIIHDIGKISVPAEILSKPTKLTDIEMSLIKAHSQTGYDILKDVGLPYPIAEIVLQHHERLDGSGYPQGLKNGEILLEAQIIAV